MKRSLLILLGLIAAAQAAQPTLTSVSTLPGGTEETPYVITYDAVKNASNASADTSRFLVVSLAQGTLASRAHGSSAAWSAVSTFPLILDGAIDLQWSPPLNAYGNRSSIRVRANNGGDELVASNNSDTDIPVGVHLANTPDPISAASGINARSGTTGPFTPPVVSVNEDAWNEFTYADLCTVLQVVNVDDSDLDFVITSLGNGTLARTSGGSALAVGAIITVGESLWWRPTANRFTWQGATPADDEAPTAVFSGKVRKTANHAVSTGTVSLTSSIADVDDPFDTAATGAATFTLVRGGAPLTMTVPKMLESLTGHHNTDRVDSLGVVVSDYRFMASRYNSSGGYAGTNTFTAHYNETVRLLIYTDAPAGTYVIGTWNACTPAGATVDPKTASVNLTVKVVEDSGSNPGGGGGGGGGGCGAGAAGGLIILGCCCLGWRRRSARR